LALTGELRRAIADVEQAGAVLAERVRQAHRARVWLALGYRSWADYAHGELGISRAQAYRLVDIAGTTQQLLEAAGALGLSPVGDLGLSGRALRDLRGRVDEFAAELAARVHARPVDTDDVAVLIRDVARDVRSRPAPEPPAEDVRPEVAEARAAVEEIRKTAGEVGELILEIAPAYQSDADVADVVGMFADEIGVSLEEALAYRRYAITGDRRCLDLVL
jgi:hypothetical protein